MNIETGNNGYLTIDKTKFQLADSGVQYGCYYSLTRISYSELKEALGKIRGKLIKNYQNYLKDWLKN